MGLGRDQTAWAWWHTLRRAMVRPGHDRLSGKRRRRAAGKGRVGIVADTSPDGLTALARERKGPGSTVQTEDLVGYGGLASGDYRHPVVKRTEWKRAPWVASLLKRCLLGDASGSSQP